MDTLRVIRTKPQQKSLLTFSPNVEKYAKNKKSFLFHELKTICLEYLGESPLQPHFVHIKDVNSEQCKVKYPPN